MPLHSEHHKSEGLHVVSLRGGISVTMMVIHAWSLWRLCREGPRIWFSVRVPFKFYWRTPPWSQKRGKTVGRLQAIYHTMFNYVYHIERLSFGGLESWVSEFKRQRLLESFASDRLHMKPGHLIEMSTLPIQPLCWATETVKLSVKYQLSKSAKSGLFLVFFYFLCFIVFYFIPP